LYVSKSVDGDCAHDGGITKLAFGESFNCCFSTVVVKQGTTKVSKGDLPKNKIQVYPSVTVQEISSMHSSESSKQR